jgi:hypothetical protein
MEVANGRKSSSELDRVRATKKLRNAPLCKTVADNAGGKKQTSLGTVSGDQAKWGLPESLTQSNRARRQSPRLEVEKKLRQWLATP